MSLLDAVLTYVFPSRESLDWQDSAPQRDPENEEEPQASIPRKNSSQEEIDVLWSRGLTGRSLALPNDPAQVPNPTTDLRQLGDIYDLGDEIGRGSFGVVQAGFHRATGVRCVVKNVDKGKVGELYLNNHVVNDMFSRLLYMSREAPHPNVINYIDFLMGPFTVHVVMEACSGDELFQRLKASAPVSLAFISRTMHQVLTAIAHIHSIGIIHRDVKLESLRYRDASTNADLVLFDFGHCCFADPEDQRRTQVGTVTYMAPESFSHTYGRKVDVWSAGVILYILLTGTLPSWSGAGESLKQPRPPSHDQVEAALYSSELQALPSEVLEHLRALLAVEPDNRPTAADALESPWLNHARRHAGGYARPPLFRSASFPLAAGSEAYRAAEMESAKSTVLEPGSLSYQARSSFLVGSTEALQEEVLCEQALPKQTVSTEVFLAQATEVLQEQMRWESRQQATSERSPAWNVQSTEVLQEQFQKWFPSTGPPPKEAPEAESDDHGKCSEPFVFTFDVTLKQLESRDSKVVSTSFCLPVSGESVPFKIHVAAQQTHQRRNGRSFRKSDGHAQLELKCESSDANLPCLVFSFSVGAAEKKQPARGPVRHNFAESAIGRLPSGQDCWDLKSALDPSTSTCSITLQVDDIHW